MHLLELRAAPLRPLGAAGGLGEPDGDGLVGGHLLEEVDLEGQVVHGLPHGCVQIGDLGPRLDVLEILLPNDHPVFEDALQLVACDAIGELLEGHRQRLREVAVRVVLPAIPQHAVLATNHRRVAAIGLLAAGDWVLSDRVHSAADVHRAALEGDREGVAVQLLQQPAARAEVHGVCAEAVREQAREHVAHRVQRHAVALQDTELLTGAATERVAVRHLQLRPDLLDDLQVLRLVGVPRREDRPQGWQVRLPVLAQDQVQDGEELRERLDAFARVGPNEREPPLRQSLRQHGLHGGAAVRAVVGGPEVGCRVPDIEAVADERHAEARHVLLDHVRERVVLRLLVLHGVAVQRDVCPRGDGRVLCSWHTRGSMAVLEDLLEASLVVVVVQEHPRPGNRVGALEPGGVVRGRAQRGRLVRGHAPVAEVQQVEHLGHVDRERVLGEVLLGELRGAQRRRELRRALAEDAVGLDGLPELARLRRHGHGVPDLDQERLQEVGEPVEPGVRVRDLEDGDAWCQRCALGKGLDLDRQLSSARREDGAGRVVVARHHGLPVAPGEHGGVVPVLVARARNADIRHVPRDEAVCLVDFGARDHLASQVLLDEVLESEEDDVLALQVLEDVGVGARGVVRDVVPALEVAVELAPALQLVLVDVREFDLAVRRRQEQRGPRRLRQLDDELRLLRTCVDKCPPVVAEVRPLERPRRLHLDHGRGDAGDDRDAQNSVRILHVRGHGPHAEHLRALRVSKAWVEDRRQVVRRAARPGVRRHEGDGELLVVRELVAVRHQDDVVLGVRPARGQAVGQGAMQCRRSRRQAAEGHRGGCR
mmetsp:Transcript_54220/g.159519  ORF Transcript_54220/g.159519 Transcript_54220/m.159519 type:complete len:822 (+) Transcript_54220:293-2758(+)